MLLERRDAGEKYPVSHEIPDVFRFLMMSNCHNVRKKFLPPSCRQAVRLCAEYRPLYGYREMSIVNSFRKTSQIISARLSTVEAHRQSNFWGRVVS
jgi:hypothetical protein